LISGWSGHGAAGAYGVDVLTLADVTPSLLAALGVPGERATLPVEPARSACLLLVDGLGEHQLREHTADAPFLSSLAGDVLEVGFPATTATSIASLGTGLPAGEHGITGCAFATEGQALHALTWCSAEGTDLRETVLPEEVQPHETVLQRAAAAGLDVRVVAPAAQQRSGLTRAALRGGDFRSIHALGDLAAGVLAAPGFCYAYHGDLDLVGHVYGPGSLPWRLQLRLVDTLVAMIAEQLPPGALLAVVADHGMVSLTDAVDADADERLTDGVRLITGEARARHVHAVPGAAADVLATWREVLGNRADVRSRAEAVAAGWFGPVVADAVLGRIGDVVAAARGGAGVVRRVAEPRESQLVGHHGARDDAERLVPFLLVRGEEHG